MKVYIATALANAPAAREWAGTLREGGISVVSKWHDIVDDSGVDPREESQRNEALTENLRGIYGADVLLALMNLGQPRATNVEIGFALGLTKPVVWIAGPTSLNDNLFSSHPLVSYMRSGSNALALLLNMARASR